jgi:hypothetical protein
MEGKKKQRKSKKDVFKIDTGDMPFSEVVRRVAKGGDGKDGKKDHKPA